MVRNGLNNGCRYEFSLIILNFRFPPVMLMNEMNELTSAQVWLIQIAHYDRSYRCDIHMNSTITMGNFLSLCFYHTVTMSQCVTWMLLMSHYVTYVTFVTPCYVTYIFPRSCWWMNEWMNEWKIWLSPGLIKNESLINQRTHNMWSMTKRCCAIHGMIA